MMFGMRYVIIYNLLKYNYEIILKNNLLTPSFIKLTYTLVLYFPKEK